jgi:transposase
VLYYIRNTAFGVEMQLNITDLQPDRFFVKIDETLSRKIEKEVVAKYASFRKIAKIMNLWPGSIYSWKNKQNYPLPVLLQICELCNIDLKIEQTHIAEVRSCFYTNKKSNYVKSRPIYPEFPIKLTPDLSSIIGHLFCDGSVSISKEGYVQVHYYNTNKVLLESFKKNAKEIFGNIHMYQSRNKGVDFVRLPSVAGIILRYFADDFNSKTCTIPNFILNGNKEVKKAFVRAFADDEGSVSFRPPHRYIELACSNYPLLYSLKQLLNDFGIQSRKIYHRTQRGFDSYWFHIRGFDHLKKFNDEIGFLHSEKSVKLKQILESPQRKNYGNEESKELLLKAFLSGQTRLEMAKSLNRSISTVDYHIRTLKRTGFIKVSKK